MFNCLLFVSFAPQYGFDGIDFDWEYPADPERGGQPADRHNYALLVQAVRDVFKTAQEDFQITMATPISKSKLNSGYDLPALAQSLDFFNMMAYDIHGTWDSPRVIGAHSDIRVIEDTVQYMLDAGVPSHQLVVGLGTYGRTYTLSDPNCISVGCGFSSGGPGGCAGSDGYMPFFTIDEYIQSGNYNSLQLNPTTGSMELVVDGSKWISFDNQETFGLKASLAADMCLGGYMWWAVDMLKEPMVISSVGAPVSPPVEPPIEPPVSAPTAPVAGPTVPVAVTAVPVAVPTAPIAVPTAPIALPTAPVAVPSTPIEPPVSAPVSTPVQDNSPWVVSTESRCGGSELDARGNCGVTCNSASDCGTGEWCWGVHANYCGSKEVTVCTDLSQATAGTRCGVNELEARERCGAVCSSQGDCSGAGEYCWGVHQNTCDCGQVRMLRGVV